MDPNLKVEFLPSVGTSYAKKLKKLDIKTVADLVYHFPFRYDDFSQISQIQNLEGGAKLTIQGIVWQIKNVRTRTGKFLTQAQVADQSGVIEIVWFNQPYLTKTIKAGVQISLSGKITSDYGKPKLISPSYEIIRNQSQAKSQTLSQPNNLATKQPNNPPSLSLSPATTTHTGRLVPIYPESAGLSSKWLRTRIKEILPAFTKTNPDFLPQSIINNQNLEKLGPALSKIHFPKNYQEADAARKRLSFDEIFLTQLMTQIRRSEWTKTRKSIPMRIDNNLIKKFIASLKFELTSAQKQAARELLADLVKKIPANRLLEGDVGSGKTIVAAIGCLVASSNNLESQIATPTEILTLQHYKLLKELLEPFHITVGIWTSTTKQHGDVTVGTHALLTSYKPKNRLGFVVVDEQHRFGVAQRAKLFINTPGKLTPHLLTMTATPIPRTLALTMYGDLDLSVLDEMPKGRQKISTFVVPNAKRAACYLFIKDQVQRGKQVFIITPFVEPSESMQTIKAATVEFEKLKKVFTSFNSPGQDKKLHKSIKLGLLHGRLKSKEKEATINEFKEGKIDILVATPVVEVGIDVPNATVILIESADRFGLAQLHQLRGRVGRGVHKSYCFLFTSTSNEQVAKRLKSMEKVHIGFELAQIDLKLRGSGEIFGLKQSGFLNFKIADLSDHKLVSAAQLEAKKLLLQDENLSNHQALLNKLHSLQNQYSQPN